MSDKMYVVQYQDSPDEPFKDVPGAAYPTEGYALQACRAIFTKARLQSPKARTRVKKRRGREPCSAQ